LVASILLLLLDEALCRRVCTYLAAVLYHEAVRIVLYAKSRAGGEEVRGGCYGTRPMGPGVPTTMGEVMRLSRTKETMWHTAGRRRTVDLTGRTTPGGVDNVRRRACCPMGCK